MHWLSSLDTQLFRAINSGWSHPLLDRLMPFCSGNAWFAPFLLFAALALLVKGGARGRICLVMLALAVGLGDGFICNTLKHAVARPRPFLTLSDVLMPPGIGRTDSGSMPSSHAANWFAAAMVLFIYYRRSWWFMLPAAGLVALSRVYNGVHYPSDVLAGAILGAGYAAGIVWTADRLWAWAGRRWFPGWAGRLPSLLVPEPRPAMPLTTALADRQWRNLAYALILLQLGVGLWFLASGTLDVAEDEAYQWLWSKHLALSYYSKPPLIAYTHWLGTALLGDTTAGVHCFPPWLAAALQLTILGFLTRVAGARAACWAVALCCALPLLIVGGALMTVDPLSVLFWTLAMVAGWRAIEGGATRDWLWVGLWSALGFLSKYTALFQWLSWLLFFCLWPPARKHLRRPGPWLALLINLLGALPVLIWNSRHHWITATHVAQGGHLEQAWSLAATGHNLLNFTTDFVLVETLLLNPFVVLPTLAALWLFLRRPPDGPLPRYLFSMGAPIVAVYFLLTLHARVQPNWIAPAIVPLLCFGVVYWDARWAAGHRRIRTWLVAALVVGTLSQVLLRAPKVLDKLAGGKLPPKYNPLKRVTGWRETAAAVDLARRRLSAEGPPVFIIGDQYGITGEIAFYLPAVQPTPAAPIPVYCRASATPENQFYFWPGYTNRHGENALFVREFALDGPSGLPVDDSIAAAFTSTKDLGSVIVEHRGQPVRRLQIIECRGLR